VNASHVEPRRDTYRIVLRFGASTEASSSTGFPIPSSALTSPECCHPRSLLASEMALPATLETPTPEVYRQRRCRSVPYRLDTPTRSAVARRLRRLVSERGCYHLRSTVENARLAGTGRAPPATSPLRVFLTDPAKQEARVPRHAERDAKVSHHLNRVTPH
jgi:hypothetical protein